MTSPAGRRRRQTACHVGVGDLMLVGAVLCGILLMHGGLGVHPGAGMMMEPATRMPAASMATPAVKPEQGAARLTVLGAFPDGTRTVLRALQCPDGHVGEMCLGVLRSLALLAGLTVLLLATGSRRRAAMAGRSAVGPTLLPPPPPPGAPLLLSLCVLRL